MGDQAYVENYPEYWNETGEHPPGIGNKKSLTCPRCLKYIPKCYCRRPGGNNGGTNEI